MVWSEAWNSSQGFWTAVQGVGTIVAAVAALVALLLARKQLGEVIRSNSLLAESNDSMTASNVALTRPYVVVDFQFRPFMDRAGSVRSTTITVHVENVGRTPAKNIFLKVDRPFPVPVDSEHPGWEEGVIELNRVMNGATAIKMLTSLRSLTYYLAKSEDIMGTGSHSTSSWTVSASYEDSEGHTFSEDWVLDLSPWRQAMVTVDPAYRIAKSVQAVAYEVKNKQVSARDEKVPLSRFVGRPRTRRVRKQSR